MLVVAAGVSAAVILLGGLVQLLSSALSGESMCENEIVHQETSIDGRKKAVVFERNCGATTSYSTHVRLLRADTALPDESGNVFVAYVDPSLVHLSWTGAESLILSCPKLPQESIFLRERESKGYRLAT